MADVVLYSLFCNLAHVHCGGNVAEPILTGPSVYHILRSSTEFKPEFRASDLVKGVTSQRSLDFGKIFTIIWIFID